MSTQQPSSNKSVIVIVSVIIGLILIMALVCGGLTLFGIKKFMPFLQQIVSDTQASQQAGSSFLADIAADKLESAYEATSDSYRKTTTIKQFREFVAKNPALVNGTAAMTQIQFLNNVMTVTFQVNSPQGQTSCTLTLVKQGDDWKVDRFTIP